jgi:hypothetical protein
MKRFLVLLIIAVLLVPAAFADVKVAGWGRVITEVSGGDHLGDGSAVGNPDAVDTVVMDQKPGWNGAGARVRFDIIGSSDQIGFAVEINTDIPHGNYYGGNIGIGDRALIWIKPVDMLKITAGRAGTIDPLRGKFGSAHGSGVEYHGGGDFQDNIFARTRVNAGILFELTPVEGLTAIVGIEVPTDPTEDDGDPLTTETQVYNPMAIGDALKQIQIGVGYNIEGIGLIRAQYIGENMLLGSEDLNIAFALTAVEGLLVDLGVKIDLSDAEDDPAIALGASYMVSDAIKIMMANKVVLGDDAIITLFLEGSYNLGAISLVLDVAADLTPDAMRLSFFPYALMGFGNGKASLGFRLDMGIDAETTSWYIPLLMEYWF